MPRNLKVASFADLMNGHSYAEVCHPFNNQVVRRLTLTLDGQVTIDALQGPLVTVPLDTPIIHEPWTMDRGNMVFHHESLVPITSSGKGKICTEEDVVVYLDGSKFSIVPR